MTNNKMMLCLPLLLAVLICTALAPLARADLYSLYEGNPGPGGLCAGPDGTGDFTWFDQPTGVIKFDETADSGFGLFGDFGDGSDDDDRACTGGAGTDEDDDGFNHQVPEPGTMTMMGAGLAAIGLLLRRRMGPR